MSTTNLQQAPACPECRSTYVVKKGRRRNRHRILQLFHCNECTHRFSVAPGKNKTYPLKVILEAISAYNLGNSLTDTQRIVRNRFHLDVPERTTRSWLKTYSAFTTYARMRAAAKKLFPPAKLIRSLALNHQQVYRCQVHEAKLELLLPSASGRDFSRFKNYLGTVWHGFPHHLFQATEHRSSKFPLDLRPPITRKENHATRMAALVLPSAPTNKARHETLQRFMLLNDSVTVAVEVPVYLGREDVAYYRSRGFNMDIESDLITGHIDFIQVRNGYIHLLDYKPEAKKEKHAHVQLTIYALALSRRTRLPLKDFKCGWFDEDDYFEFFPLQGVYHPKSTPAVVGKTAALTGDTGPWESGSKAA
jgi:hypothetical protein